MSLERPVFAMINQRIKVNPIKKNPQKMQKRIRINEAKSNQLTKLTGLPASLKTLIENYLTLCDFGRSFARVCKAFRSEWMDYRSNRLTTVYIERINYRKAYNAWVVPPVEQSCTFKAVENIAVMFNHDRTYRGNAVSSKQAFQSVLAMTYASVFRIKSLDLRWFSIHLDHQLADLLPALPKLHTLHLDEDCQPDEDPHDSDAALEFQRWLSNNARNLVRLTCWWSSISPSLLKTHACLRELHVTLETEDFGSDVDLILSSAPLTSLKITVTDFDNNEDNIEVPLRKALNNYPNLHTLGFSDQNGYCGSILIRRSVDEQDESFMMVEVGKSDWGVHARWFEWLPKVDNLSLRGDEFNFESASGWRNHSPTRLCVPWTCFEIWKNKKPFESVQHLHLLLPAGSVTMSVGDWNFIVPIFPNLITVHIDKLAFRSPEEHVPSFPPMLKQFVVHPICWFEEGTNKATLYERMTRESNGIFQLFYKMDCKCQNDFFEI